MKNMLLNCGFATLLLFSLHGIVISDEVETAMQVINDFYQRYSALDKVDIVFVLDRYNRDSRNGWLSTANFVKNILDPFVLDPNSTRIAIVTFSTTVSVEMNYLETGPTSNKATKCSVFHRISQTFESPQPYGHSAAYNALLKALSVVKDSRIDSKKAVIFLTDGPSNIGPPPALASRSIQSLSWNQNNGSNWNVSLFGPQVEIYAFGIRGAIKDELDSVASDLPHHSFHMSDFSLFDKLQRRLHRDKWEKRWAEVVEIDHCGSFSCRFPHSGCMCGTKTGQYTCACQPGYELDGLQCKACEKGFYKEDFAPHPCQPCPQNSTTAATGSVRADDCQLLAGFRTCPILPNINHASKFYVAGQTTDEVANTNIDCDQVTDGNSCHYVCDDGYRLSGSPILMCNSSGEWEGTIPSCDIVTCQNFTATQQESFAATVDLSNGTTYGSIAEANCTKPSSIPFGHTSWTCNKYGLWTRPGNFQCKEVFCGVLPTVKHARYNLEECGRGQVPLGFKCQLSCEEGFHYSGKPKYTCEYEGRPVWNPKELPICQDVQPPLINCPGGKTLTVSGWNDNSTLFDYRVDKANYTDNSDNVSYTINGGPDDNRFYVGQTLLTYQATDGSGNKGFCQRLIIVKEKTVEKKSCPKNITLQVNTSDRMRSVTWTDPIFIGHDDVQLEFKCSHTNGDNFTFGSHKVVCFPIKYPSTEYECKFQIDIIDPVCNLPFPDRIPVNGEVVCNTTRYAYAKLCEVKCHEGYELKRKEEFVCWWNGTWNLNAPWPECHSVKRSSKVIMENKLNMKLKGGSCTVNKGKIVETFLHCVDPVLKKADGLCQSKYQCRIKKMDVECNDIGMKDLYRSGGIRQFEISRQHFRRRRSGGETEVTTSSYVEATVESLVESPTETTTSLPNTPVKGDVDVTFVFVLEGELRSTNKSYVEETDQEKLVEALDDTLFLIEDNIKNSQFHWEANGINTSLSIGDEITTEITEFVGFNCSVGEIFEKGKRSASCSKCPIGSWYVNETACDVCPLGTYQDQEGSVNCSKCPGDKNTTFKGARNATECLDLCPVGYHSGSGYEPCAACPVGTFQDNVRMTACNECPNGTSTLKSGSSNIRQCLSYCPANSFSSTGLEPCSPCEVGEHQSELGSFSCVLCTETSNSSYCPEPVNCDSFNMTCGEHGSCIEYNQQLQCLCREGFTGELCTENIDDCIGVDCKNGGTCVDGISDYSCECLSTFTGLHCELDLDECIMSPCMNNGSCVNAINGYTCVCADGYDGSHCEHDKDECLLRRCQRGRCIDGVNRFTCICDPGYTGELCDKHVDYCASAPCLNGGRCKVVDPEYVCHCPPGFTGLKCEAEFDACSSNPCRNNGTCTRTLGSFLCKCPLGFSGKTCTQEISGDFDLVFKEPSISNFVSLRLWNVLHAVTVCVWIRTNDMMNYGTVWSYSVENNYLTVDNANVLTAYDYGNLQLFINGYVATTGVSLNNGMWHHLCLTWEGSSGNWQIYVNGTVKQSGLGLAKGTHIEGGGHLILGQEQDSVGGRFNIRESFVGEMSQFVLFDSVLSNQEIAGLASSGDNKCQSAEGSVLSWTDIPQNIRGHVVVRRSSHCLDVNECQFPGLINCTEKEQCIDLVGSFKCKSCETTDDPDCAHALGTKNQCLPNPCLNGGTCQPDLSKDVCQCPAEYAGKNCEEERNVLRSCNPNPCNGGTCTISTTGIAACTCAADRIGRYCQVSVKQNCDQKPCINNGTCISIEHDSYRCDCPPSNHTLGPNCEIQTVCSSGPCLSNSTCVDLSDGKYLCVCGFGFEGSNCEIAIITTTPKPFPQEMGSSSTNMILYISIGVLLTIIVTAAVVLLLVRCTSRNRRHSKLDNKTNSLPMRVSNPMYQCDYPMSTNLSNPPAIEESLYCEPRELIAPYATSEDSDKDSDPETENNHHLNVKRKKNRFLRQSIPLPPKPGNEKSISPASSTGRKSPEEWNRATPPPPYYPSRYAALGQPPAPPARCSPLLSHDASSRNHSYANEGFIPSSSTMNDSCYFMPLSDEEADRVSQKKSRASVADSHVFEPDNAYLLPRNGTDASDSPNADTIELKDLSSNPSKNPEEQTPKGDKDNESIADKVYAIRRDPSNDSNQIH